MFKGQVSDAVLAAIANMLGSGLCRSGPELAGAMRKTEGYPHCQPRKPVGQSCPLGFSQGNTSIALFGLGISIRALAARDFGARKGSRVDSGWAWVEEVFGVETMVQKK
uniref:Uncharacterized protein n=1 Tax=Fagus sylvatica TaxID=28930 RepID=A0A2N9GM27_FAGSY